MFPLGAVGRSPRGLALAAVLLAALAGSAGAQGRGGGPGRSDSGGGPNGAMGGGGMRGPDMSHHPFDDRPSLGSSRSGESRGDGPTRGGLQLGPPGRWWDNREFAQTIGLDPGQQRRMDDVFGANKGTLVKLFKNLQHEESQLEKVTRARELNEAQIFDQIDRVVQARGELEKASAHMLLQIRKEMTPEQASRLDDHRPSQ